LNLIPPKHNPMKQDLPDRMFLTRSWKLQNERARQNNGKLIFDLMITCKDSLAECFRIFTDPEKSSTNMTRRYRHRGPTPCCEEITIYTDGTCMNNGKKNAQCSSRVWFGHKDPRNKAVRIPGKSQSNQVAKIATIIIALESVPPYQLIKIITDSKYVIEGLTNHLETWEDDGWIGIKNTTLFKKATYLMRHQSAKTTMKWVKGHDRVQGNKGSDALAKQGANKQTPDTLNLEIPPEFDVQGAKLPTLIQVTAYKGILEQRESEQCKTTKKNMKLTHTAIKRITGKAETDAAIWLNMQKKAIRLIIQQFIYKTIHRTHLVGKYWRNIDSYEE